MKRILLIALAGAGIVYGQKPVAITDTVLNMKAYTMTIPSNWLFEGTVMAGTSCISAPAAIYRAYSPDGITEVKQMPRLDWAWTKGGSPTQASDCLPFAKEMSASDFLKYMVGILQVSFVREEPVPELAQVRQNVEKQNQSAAASAPGGIQASSSKVDMARFTVRYQINNIAVEERLNALVSCTDAPIGYGQNVTHVYSCGAYMTRKRARQGNLEASEGLFKSIDKSFAIDQQWSQQWNALKLQKIQNYYAATARVMQAQRDSYRQSQEVRARQHEEWMAVTRRGTDMAMNRANEAGDARHRVAGDWADYALDLQKRRDSGTGEITKDSSRYSYTWVNESGQRYQTNDINDNPNGQGTGNWTVQQNVR